MSYSNLKNMALALLLAAGAVTTAQADDHGSKGPTVPPSPKYLQECAACHIAYPVGMLPAASWQHLMGSLNKHYGTDASLDAASQRDISDWLKANAGTYKRVSEAPPQDRITQSAWFLRKHRDGEVPAGVWKRASVGSAANCAACHPQAAQGRFSEHDIRIPK
ncbi:MAG: diheme cytochrome c [Pseudomonadota bacterium]